jgi:hypothetical protein
MIITGESHLDHGLSPVLVAHIKERFASRDAFFIETFALPPDLEAVPCGLIGPATGYAPVIDADVVHVVRGDRKCASRVLLAPRRPIWVRVVTVIAGPDGPNACVLYTAFGGPKAPREPGDPAIGSWAELIESRDFWAQHALVAAL